MLLLKDSEIIYHGNNTEIFINKSVVSQIILNLVDNAFKYSNQDKTIIKAEFQESFEYYTFKIIDNGIGIPKEKQKEIFELFKTAGVKDKDGREGTGIGLATVKNLVSKLGGEISLKSELNQGSTFTFTIKK